ncbi:MAG: alpha/beta hydrolase [Candidatus Micrarchaeota archaeon]
MRFALYILLGTLVMFFGCLVQEPSIPTNSTIPDNNLAPQQTEFHNIQYSNISDTLILDIYLPANTTDLFPTIIYVHGGGWREGTKDSCPHKIFVEEGYIVSCIDYRLSQEAKFPAQIQDVKTAIRWLRANSERYRMDTNRFGIFGMSAGGHLSSLVGTSGGITNFDTNENSQYSSEVDAVADWYGPVSFILVENITNTTERYYEYAFCGNQLFESPINESHNKAMEANPITYITPDDPPFLIMHGSKDDIVPISESELLYNELKKNGIDATFIVIDDYHGFPDSELEKVVEFFDKTLKN